MVRQPIVRSVPTVVVERGSEAAKVPATVVGAAVKHGEAKPVEPEDVGNDVVDSLVDLRFLVGGPRNGRIQTVGGLLTKDHDHDEEDGRELRRAPDGLACTGDAVCRRSDAELLPRTNKAAPVGPLPERHDTCSAEDGHDGRGVEHETSGVPSHEGGCEHPDAEHEGRPVAVAKTSPEQSAAHDEGKQEGNGPEGSKELRSVWSVGFCNRAENLRLREVATSREQDVPCVGNVKRLQDVEQGKEHRSNTCEGSQDEQPRLVAETGGDEGDGDREPEDEQEGLETGWVEHQVELRMRVERQRHQEDGGQHHQEHHAEGG